ncbi:trichohyalin-like [Palaemon carinicauda]|uniref:trichohyalin-like n=1 Tax=Palaemon carinicauda TaxID=392227 RepID=UPI0035B68027
MVDEMGEKQKADLEGKPQDERKHLRREAEEVALMRIRKIAQDEISQEKSDKVYVRVELWEEPLKDEKTEKKQRVNLEEIEEEIVKRRIQYFENILQGNIKKDGDLRENIIQGNGKEEGDLRRQSPDLRKNLNRKAKDIALARITQIIQVELSEEQNENVWKAENIKKELQDYQEANIPGTQGDSASNCDDYAEIRMDEISQEKSDKVYAPVELWEEALKDEKTEKKQKVNLEEIEEGIVKRHIQYFENIIRGNIKEEGDLCGQSPDFRENLNRVAKDITLSRITRIIQEELSEQIENVWRSENIEKELKDYLEANGPGAEGDSASKGREAKEVALIRIRQIAQDEISQEKSNLVYTPVELWEEALKDKKTEKKQKINLEEIEVGVVERRIQYFENITRGNIKEEGDNHEQFWDLRNHLERTAKDVAWARNTLATMMFGRLVSESLEYCFSSKWLKGEHEKTEKKQKVNLAEIEEGIVKGRIQYFENIIRGNIKEEGDLRENVIQGNIKEEGDLRENIIQGNIKEEGDLRENIIQGNIKKEGNLRENIIQGNIKEEGDLRENIIQGNIKEEGDLRENVIQGNIKEEGDLRENVIQGNIKEEGDLRENIIQGNIKEEGDLRENIIQGNIKKEGNLRENIIQGNIKEEGDLRENIIQGNIKEEGDLRGQSPDLRKNLNRKAKDIAMARITQIIQEELSGEQNENVCKSENIVKELQDYQEANSPGTYGDSASNCDDYAEIRMVNIMREKQKADLEGKPQDERKHLRREAKEVALIRIRQIAQDEISQEKSDKVYAPVQLWEEVLKDEKTEKKQKINLEEIEEWIVERRIQYFENITRGNIEEEGDPHGQSWDLRNHLERAANDVASARFRNILQEVIKEENFEE